MQTITSAQAGLIAVKTAAGYTLEDIESGERTEAGSRELAYYFLGCADLIFDKVTAINVVRAKARISWAAERALILFIYLLDPLETEDQLRETAEQVELLLERSGRVLRLVEYSLYAHELPHPIAYSRITAAIAGKPLTAQLFESFNRRQPIIAHVRLAFDNIGDENFDEIGRGSFWRLATSRGLIRTLVIEADSERGIDNALFDLYAGMKDQPNSRDIIRDWTEGFKRTPRAVRDWDALKEPPSLLEFTGAGVSSKRAFESAVRQQQAILDKVRVGDVETARRYAADLIHQQREESGPEHLAKSLTRLSKEARDLEAYELSLEWAQEAVCYKPDDPRTHTQVAEALIHYGRYAEAEESLRAADVFGESRFAATLRARILRLQNRLPEALESYRKVQEDYIGTEEEPYGWAGVAEVLRDLGRLDEALDEYTRAVVKFPQFDGIRCGRAATLAEMGRFEAALDVYKDIIGDNFNVVARSGEASVYKETGNFEQAAILYRQIANSEPYDVMSRCGLVDALEKLGQVGEAINLAQEVRRRFPESAYALRALGDVLRDAGYLPEAAETYGLGVEHFPFNSYFPSALAQVERIRGRYDDALTAYEAAINKFPHDKRLEAGRAAMLRRLGRVDEALKIYDRILESNKDLRFATNAKASILIYKKRYDDALSLLQVDDPRTKDEWKAFILRAILDLRTGYIDAAEDRLAWGIEHVRFERVRKMMSATLGNIRLRRNQPKQALGVTESCSGDITALVRLHALASAKERGARAFYDTLRLAFIPEQYAEVREEIARVYGLVPEKPRRSEAWLYESETTALLLEAA